MLLVDLSLWVYVLNFYQNKKSNIWTNYKQRVMIFDNIDFNDNPNSILIIVLIEILKIISIIIISRDWKSKVLRRNWDWKK